MGDDASTAINAAIAKTEHELRLVPADGDHRSAWIGALDERLRRLAVKVAPTAAPAQTVEWRSAMTDALSDLPAMIALTAAKNAIHRPFRFIGDIEAGVREIAAELLAERETRLRGLQRMRAEVERAMTAATSLPAPAADAAISPELIRAMKPELRRMGLKAGYITAADIEAAMADQREAA